VPGMEAFCYWNHGVYVEIERCLISDGICYLKQNQKLCGYVHG